MKAITGTRKLFQFQGDLQSVSDGKWSLHTSPLQCACPPCQSNPADLDLCIYKEERNVTTVVVKKLVIEDDAVLDPYRTAQITVKDLKVELKERGLPAIGLTPVLKEQLVQYLIENGVVRDDTVENDGLGKAVV